MRARPRLPRRATRKRRRPQPLSKTRASRRRERAISILILFHSAHCCSRFARRRPQSHRCSRRAQGKAAVTRARLTTMRAATTGRPTYAAIAFPIRSVAAAHDPAISRMAWQIVACNDSMERSTGRCSPCRPAAHKEGKWRRGAGAGTRAALTVIVHDTSRRRVSHDGFVRLSVSMR